VSQSCDPKSNENRVTISQGVSGTVCFWEGDFMPHSDSGRIIDLISNIFSESEGTIKPVAREIYISRVITVRDATDSHAVQTRGEFLSFIPAKIVATTSSDKKGFYQLELPPGSYTIFVKENNAFYANRFDAERRITPFEVRPKNVTKMPLDITYKSYE